MFKEYKYLTITNKLKLKLVLNIIMIFLSHKI